MSMASAAFKRLCGLYRFVFHRMRQHEARLFGGLGRCDISRGRAELGAAVGAGPGGCRIEPLEPRLLLDTTGPQIVSHWPDIPVGPADHIDLTFNESVDPATLTADDLRVLRSEPLLLGNYDTTGQARGVMLDGNIAYVADYTAGLQIIDVSDPSAPVPLGGCAARRSAV